VDRALTDDEAFIVAVKAELRRNGWFVRYTEWPQGHQVTLHLRSDTSRHVVTEWHDSEAGAFREALRLADEAAPRPREEPWQPSVPLG
jgi:hypothetical protein